MIAAATMPTPKKWSGVSCGSGGRGTEGGELVAPGEVDAYSGCYEEEEEGTDLYEAVFSDCVFGDVA